jgi:hypothetical protein
MERRDTGRTHQEHHRCNDPRAHGGRQAPPWHRKGRTRTRGHGRTQRAEVWLPRARRGIPGLRVASGDCRHATHRLARRVLMLADGLGLPVEGRTWCGNPH